MRTLRAGPIAGPRSAGPGRSSQTRTTPPAASRVPAVSAPASIPLTKTLPRASAVTARARDPMRSPLARNLSRRTPASPGPTVHCESDVVIRVRCGRRHVNLRFVQPGAAALRAFARLGELVVAEREAARSAARRLDHDAVPGRASRANQVTQVVFDVGAFEPELVGDGGSRPRLSGEDLEQILAERHLAIIRPAANSCVADGKSVCRSRAITNLRSCNEARNHHFYLSVTSTRYQ